MSEGKQSNPYKNLSNSSFWRRSVAGVDPAELDPIIATKFEIGKSDKVATAGSCFAQHIAHYLSKSNYNYYVAEPGHTLLPEPILRSYNYGTFSCRYGNVYTTRQLLQLIERTLGFFIPQEPVWQQEDGKFIDPFRPQIQPGGFSTLQEFMADRQAHLRAVHTMATTMDVFVFTLGLTETWMSKADGAVFPVCPGCGAGEFDDSKYQFVNFGVEEVVADLRKALSLLKSINPKLKVLLTVSPVPLIATYERTHVLQATTYSKSVLRVAADIVSRDSDYIDYFPSYEIITGGFTRGRYFEQDLREVREEGVSHVMKTFLRHYVGIEIEKDPIENKSQDKIIPSSSNSSGFIAAGIVCDEEILDME